MSEPKEKKGRGRPTKYSEKVCEDICAIIASSNKGLHAISRMDDRFPSVKVMFDWLNKYPEFRNKYARAKELQAEYLGEELIDIADDKSGDEMVINKGGEDIVVENKEFVNRSRLKIDTRKWVMSKLIPKKYGDKLDLTSDGEKLESVQVVMPSNSREIPKK